MMNTLKKAVTFLLLIGVMATTSLATATDSATYVYDNQGRLVSITYTNGTTITYTYDSEGNRINEVVTCSGGGC